MSTDAIRSQLRRYFHTHKELPSIREFCELLGKTANYRTQAKRMLDNLVEIGFLSQNEKGKYLPGAEFSMYEVHHSVRAGHFTAASDLKSKINLDQFLIDDPATTLIIEVSGDSMIEAGISGGDLAIVKKGRYKTGDIIVARLNDEYTIKYLQRDAKGDPYLRPANHNYTDIYFSTEDHVEIVGIVTKVIKTFN